MKKQVLLFVLMLMPLMASAEKVEINGFIYNLIPKAKQAEVTAGQYIYSGDIIIPETVSYEGITYSVTAIGEYAFNSCSSITSITIPITVTSINDFAFRECSNLANLPIPNGVTSIGKFAFEGCESITSITIPNSVTSIGEYAFDGCSSLTSMIIPDGVSTIEDGTFYKCTNLASVTIPHGVISIGENAFFSCMSLSSVTIPNSVSTIGKNAFCCTNLISVTIPNSVKSIGESAFSSCGTLETIIIGKNVTNIYNKAFAYCENLTKVTCLAKQVPSTQSDAFEKSLIKYATLFVPSLSFENYQTTLPWSEFGTTEKLSSLHRMTYVVDGKEYKTIEYEEGESITPEPEPTKEGYYFSGWSEIPETMPAHDVTVTGSFLLIPQCAKPTITLLANGKVKVESATEGATCVTNITASNAEPLTDGEISLNTPLIVYTITSYATKEGYNDSEVVTATFRYEKAEGDVNSDGKVNISDVTELVNMILGQ